MMEKIQKILEQINLIRQNLRFSHVDSTIMDPPLQELQGLLADYCFNHRRLEFREVEKKLLVNNEAVEQENPLFEEFAVALSAHHMHRLVFNSGVGKKELVNLARILDMNPSRLTKEQVEEGVKEANFEHILVEMFSIQIVREDQFYTEEKKQDARIPDKIEKRKKILVVEDNARLRAAYKEELEEKNYDVIEAGDGNDALTIMEQRGLPNLMILDIKMPGMHGMQVLETMKGRKYFIPVIIATSYPALKDEFVIQVFPSVRLLVKPFSYEELCDTIEKMIG